MNALTSWTNNHAGAIQQLDSTLQSLSWTLEAVCDAVCRGIVSFALAVANTPLRTLPTLSLLLQNATTALLLAIEAGRSYDAHRRKIQRLKQCRGTRAKRVVHFAILHYDGHIDTVKPGSHERTPYAYVYTDPENPEKPRLVSAKCTGDCRERAERCDECAKVALKTMPFTHSV